MNIHDVASPKLPKGCKMTEIFQQQHKLMGRYLPIEKTNGLLQTEDIPVDLHDLRGQARLKDFAWRIVEELGEALHALEIKGPDDDHTKEEIADALHFLVEMAILSDITPEDLARPLITTDAGDVMDLLWQQGRSCLDIEDCIASFIKELGMACNNLKNKPWKQSQMLTDIHRYRADFMEAFYLFVDICRWLDLTANDMYCLYFRKAEVNKFRQRSNY